MQWIAPDSIFHSGQLQMGSKQAETNYRFVSVLKESCHHLAEATPSEIPTMMPKILKTLRMIWVTSEFYNTVDLITGFLQKVWNLYIQLPFNLVYLFGFWYVVQFTLMRRWSYSYDA